MIIVLIIMKIVITIKVISVTDNIKHSLISINKIILKK